jgi:hypothetical protein
MLFWHRKLMSDVEYGNYVFSEQNSYKYTTVKELKKTDFFTSGLLFLYRMSLLLAFINIYSP